jgi:hypothetical protein
MPGHDRVDRAGLPVLFAAPRPAVGGKPAAEGKRLAKRESAPPPSEITALHNRSMSFSIAATNSRELR